MDFAGIGKLGSYVKQKNLTFAANYRIKTGQSVVNSIGNLTLTKATFFTQSTTAKTNSISATEKARLASIKSKLKSGKKLSAAEMNYLKEKDPSTYKKAKYADETREELKNELRNVETKQEARQAVMRAMAKIAADCSADFEALKGGAAGGINFGGVDSVISMDSGNAGGETLNVEGAANVSSGEISGANAENVGTAENVTNENSVANAENVSNENSVANAENVSNENFNTQENNFQINGEKSDGAFDIMEKYIYAVRAVQDEWLNFIKSDKYKEMPENFLEKIQSVKIVDAILAYKKSMNYRV